MEKVRKLKKNLLLAEEGETVIYFTFIIIIIIILFHVYVIFSSNPNNDSDGIVFTDIFGNLVPSIITLPDYPRNF